MVLKMRGEKIFKILAHLEYSAKSFLDLFEAIATTYPTSFAKIQQKAMKGRKLFFEELYFEAKEKEKLAKLVYKLKKDGLIYEVKKGKERRLYLTSKGKDKLNYLKSSNKSKKEENKEDQEKSLVMITYDIPEYESKKRKQLRNFLLQNHFRFLQKSVWFKNGKISEKFIEKLNDLKVLDYVKIFKIQGRGNIEK